MLLGHFIGASILVPSVIGIIREYPIYRFEKRVKQAFQVYYPDQNIRIRKTKKTKYGFYMEITLPVGLTTKKFQEQLDGIEQSTTAKIRFQQIAGSLCSLQFGCNDLSKVVLYDQIPKNGLKIPLMTHFGIRYLDLRDNACCHILGGGATRMGKTKFLDLVITHSLVATKGKVQIVVATPKITDFFPYKGIPQITLCETPEDTKLALSSVLLEMDYRKQRLKEKGDVADANDFRKKYPDEKFDPILVIVDEVGAFADKTDTTCKEVREQLTEIAERAGYLDIHLIAFAQRPDAKDVLNPRIKTNMLTKIAFTTASERDSYILLDLPDAAHLGRIPGRVILMDGFPEMAQVPYLSHETIERLVKPYKTKEFVEYVDESRQKDNSTPETLPRFVKGSVGTVDLPGSGETAHNDQPDYETFEPGRLGHSDPTTERSVLPIHAESDVDSSAVLEDSTFLRSRRSLHRSRKAKNLRSRATY